MSESGSKQPVICALKMISRFPEPFETKSAALCCNKFPMNYLFAPNNYCHISLTERPPALLITGSGLFHHYLMQDALCRILRAKPRHLTENQLERPISFLLFPINFAIYKHLHKILDIHRELGEISSILQERFVKSLIP
jgi:hypothetical protein